MFNTEKMAARLRELFYNNQGRAGDDPFLLAVEEWVKEISPPVFIVPEGTDMDALLAELKKLPAMTRVSGQLMVVDHMGGQSIIDAAIAWRAARVAVMALSVADPEYKARFAALADAEAALAASVME